MSISRRNGGGPIDFVVSAESDLASIANPASGQFALALSEGSIHYHSGTAWVAISTGGGGGAPTDADYLVGTANGSLSAEIVVGTAPGGELGGTWATPTVDATHSGSTHGAATTTHEAAADPHTGYVLESLLDAKGDLISASADNTPVKLTVGTRGYTLVADSSATSGLRWVPDVFNVKAFGAVADSDGAGGGTDDSTAIQAAINACDSNRGGTVFVPQGLYRIAVALTVTSQGTRIVGEGQPGTNRSIAKGSSRFVVDNGVTAITFNPGASPTHLTLGYGMERIHVMSATGSTTGNGILVQDAERFSIVDVTASDFIGGYGMRIDGKSGNAQYAELRNFSAGDCLTGLDLKGTAPNGVRLWGGYYEGAGVTPRASSIGIHVETGDTIRLYGTVIQGYATGMYLASAAAGNELYGPRFEYCNLCLRIGASAQKVAVFGGCYSNTLLANPGSGNIGIQVDSGAADTLLMPTTFEALGTDIDDSGTRTLKIYPAGVPAGELGGTWSSPTVDATHAGGTHLALGTTPSTQAFSDAAAGGSDATASKNDHKHAWPALGTTAAAVGTSAGGSATTPSKSDHIHATGAGTPSTQAMGDAAAIGSGPAASMTDHKHAMPALGTTAATVSTASAGGSAATPSKSDHVHDHEAAHINHDTTWAAKGDLIVATANDTATALGVGTQGHVLTADPLATNGVSWQIPAGYPATGITIENFSRLGSATANGTTGPASGTLRVTAIWLPKGFTVASITVCTVGALTLGTSPHFWVALYDSSKGLLRQSTDNTAAVMAASSIITTNLSSTFQTTYSGLHYAAFMVGQTGGTIPTLVGTNLAAVAHGTGVTPILGGSTNDTGLTATAPNPFGTITAGVNTHYTGVA